MGRWLELAAKLEQEAGTGAVSVISADSPHIRYACFANGPNDTIGTPRSSPIVADWGDAIAALDPAKPPHPLADDHWRQMLRDAAMFLDRWAEQANALGWSTLDLFGVSPGFARRLDRDGLLYRLNGRPVVAMTAETARIKTGSGCATRYYRMKREGAVTWWSAAHRLKQP